ncbi:MAG: hypothetical protein ACOH2H_12225 [Cypionkella sp.]
MLIFGVMRLVNIAHGDLIALAAYVAMEVIKLTGLHPLVALIFVVPVMDAFGYALQRGILNRTLGGDLLPPLLVSFGVGHPAKRPAGDLHRRQPQTGCGRA